MRLLLTVAVATLLLAGVLARVWSALVLVQLRGL